MPKLKANRSAKKRFKPTSSGNFIHKSSHRRHILTKKRPKRKRQLRGNPLIDSSDVKSVQRMLVHR